jgi:hypothetical protein
MKTKFKWNWGTGIALVYSLFALSIIALVVSSFRKKLDLDSKDYYLQELVFQNQIDKSNRARSLKSPLKWVVERETIRINYPQIFAGSRITGNIYLFKPSDNNADVNFQINADKNLQQEITTSTLSKGMYKIRIDWAVNGLTFFNDGVIEIK